MRALRGCPCVVMPHVAHSSRRTRTSDVASQQSVKFSDMMLQPAILKGLTEAGFHVASPIQTKAIPLGRFGVDLVAQAKSGTGKTCVFSVVVLEGIDLSRASAQALILAPTREIAVQITEVISTIGKYMQPPLGVACCIGGTSLRSDRAQVKGRHVVVGTPGRVKQLFDNKIVRPAAIRIAVLDEADQLLQLAFRGQVSWILSQLPVRKQTLIFSATYPSGSLDSIVRYMRDPQHVRLSADEPSLAGVKQFYTSTIDDRWRSAKGSEHTQKNDSDRRPVSRGRVPAPSVLLDLLSQVAFHQCVVFTNDRGLAVELVSQLNRAGWPSVAISGEHAQKERREAMVKLREFRIRVLVSTDLTARGIDIEHVSLVVNMGLPKDAATYLHRVGRTGRFGTLGVCITVLGHGDHERQRLLQFAEQLSTEIEPLGDLSTLPREYFASELEDEKKREAFNKLSQVREQVPVPSDVSSDESDSPVRSVSPHLPSAASASSPVARDRNDDDVSHSDVQQAVRQPQTHLLHESPLPVGSMPLPDPVVLDPMRMRFWALRAAAAYRHARVLNQGSRHAVDTALH